MSKSNRWEPCRDGLRYVVERRVFSNFAGSGYRYARDDAGNVRRFWTLKSAQAAADALNAERAKESGNADA